MNNYWSQWSGAELMSMHGIEIDGEDGDCNDEEDFSVYSYEISEDFCCSAACSGLGCAECLL